MLERDTLPLAGAVGSTIPPCAGCPTGHAWEVQAAFDKGLNVEIATDPVRTAFAISQAFTPETETLYSKCKLTTLDLNLFIEG